MGEDFYREGVTVVIPNWNHELLLPRSVLSGLRALEVLRAGGTPGEVLVVDDASRDGSPTLLRQLEALYHRAGLRVLALARNGGLAAARNLGLTQARYRSVVLMDADNELVPANVPAFHRALRETEAAGVYGNLLVRKGSSRTAVNVASNESFQSRMFQDNYVDAFAIFDRVQLLDGGGYEGSCRSLEDYEQALHLACTGRRLVFVPLVFGYYYDMPGSMLKDETVRAASHQRAQRIFNQLGARPHLPPNTNRLRFHPELGYL